jgi:hypothetical protein
MKYLLFLIAFCALAGCSTIDLKPADSPQTTPPPSASANASPKVKQWFTTDTPETLPKDKLDKMSLGGGGFGGY